MEKFKKLFRKQFIYTHENEKNRKIIKGVELLVNGELKQELINILSQKKEDKNVIKKRKIEFDKKVIDLLHKNKEKLIHILKEKDINYININIFPETLLQAYYYFPDYLQKIADIAKESKTLPGDKKLVIEILENGVDSNNIIGKDYITKLMEIKKQIKSLYYLDDITSEILEQNNTFTIEYLYKHKIIDGFKVDINFFKWIIKNRLNTNYFINVLATSLHILKNEKKEEIIIVFEGVETEEEYQILLKIKEKIENIIGVKIYMQGFWLHKPETVL